MRLLGFFEGKPYIIYSPEELMRKRPRAPIDFDEIARYASDQRKERKTKDGDKNV